MKDERDRSVTPVHRSSFILHRAALVLLAVIIAALAITSVRLDSATADEGAHIAAGVIKLQDGWLSFFPEQPPLMNVLSALAAGDVNLPADYKSDIRRGHWSVGYQMLYHSGNDPDRLLFRARMPTIALFVALCFAVYWVVAAEVGKTWGVVAFALTGFCPNLLAHGRLATVDLAVTAFAFLSFAFLLRALKTHGAIAGALSGIFATCAMLSKTSGAIVPLFLAVAALLHARKETNPKPLLKPAIAAVVAGVATLYLVTFALISDAYIAAQFPNASRIAIPWLQYKYHVDSIRYWYGAGHANPQFFLGQFSTTGWPHYYFIAFLLKTPLGAILLTILALVAARRTSSTALHGSLFFVVLFLLISMTSKIALGIRYVLPIYPFLYAAIPIALAKAIDNQRKRIVVGLLLVWHCLSSLIAWPSYISYFNELIGPHRNADRFLIDSNLDWGQDLRRLRLWCEENKVPFIRIDYFGAGDPAHEFGNRAQRLTAPRPELLPKGWFAVSRHYYRLSFEYPHNYDDYFEASGARYVTTVGGSIDVYRVE